MDITFSNAPKYNLTWIKCSYSFILSFQVQFKISSAVSIFDIQNDEKIKN